MRQEARHTVPVLCLTALSALREPVTVHVALHLPAAPHYAILRWTWVPLKAGSEAVALAHGVFGLLTS